MLDIQERWTTKRVIEFIKSIENTLDVHELQYNGIHFWPILRIQISFQLDSLVAHTHNAKLSQHVHSALYKATKIPKEIGRYYSAILLDRKHTAQGIKNVDYFFYTYSSARRFRVNGLWYDVYCDPIIDEITKRGESYLSIEYTDSSGYRLPRYSHSRLEHPLLPYLLHLRALQSEKKEFSVLTSKILAEYYNLLTQAGLAQFIPDEASLRFRIATVRQFAEMFKKIFNKYQPAFAFGSNYYGFREMGMNVACKESGVIAVDIQHGVQGAMHVAYGQWLKLPLTGYEVLPKIFWNWSEEEKKIIDEWSRNTNKAHYSIVGGNPLLEQFADERNALPQLFSEQIERIFFSIPEEINKHVLITLQPDIGINDTLSQMFQHSPKNIFWWVRLHPNMLTLKEQYEKQLKAILHLQWNIADASQLPLYVLLKKMDTHITVSSSTVIEAEYFHIPSIIIHESGRELFAKQITNKSAKFADNYKEILDSILMSVKNVKLPSDTSSSLINRGLEHLFSIRKQ